jgi:DNA-binding transcriptional ArsR family regulator
MRSLKHPSVKEMTLDGVLYALSDPARLAFVRSLHAGCSKMCGEMSQKAKAMAPSTINHHLRILRESGLVFSERDGVKVNNRLRSDEIEKRFPGLLDAVLRQK